MSIYTLPAPDAPAEDWGRVAVSLPGWRWMPGMLCIWPNGNEWRVGQVNGVDGENDLPNYPAGGWGDEYPDRTGGHPDPDDAATAGCLLALLEPASPCPFRRPGGLWVVTAGQTIHGAWAISPLPLGRACIAAAEAIGRWPGGAG